MAFTNLGPVGFKPKGAYSDTKSYTRLDVVEAYGGSYIALKALTGVPPTEDATDENWQCLTKKGQGPAGPAPTIGENGNWYSDGTDTGVKANFQSQKINVILAAASWTGDAAPHSCTIENSAITAESTVEVALANDATDEQALACGNAQVLRIVQEAGKVTLYASGTVPTVDIPIVLIIRGDV